MKDFYSRTSCEVQPILSLFMDANPAISTHAPLARCNAFLVVSVIDNPNFYSRTSCEVQLMLAPEGTGYREFLLTHLLRGATPLQSITATPQSFLLTHLLRGATKTLELKISISVVISTHTPLARCNHIYMIILKYIYNFYSRTSCEVQHTAYRNIAGSFGISTHAPLARCNSSSSWLVSMTSLFLLTHLLRGATNNVFTLFLVL